jgi:hypothetical protein
MKYLEELENGDCFSFGESNFVITCDSKFDGRRLCINLLNGEPRWFKNDAITDKIAIFYTDKDGNIIAVKETKKDVIS